MGFAKHRLNFVLGLVLCVAGLPDKVDAQWTYPSCSDIPANLSTGFAVTPIVSRALFPSNASNDTLARPIKMALDTNGGKLDIFFTEKFGKIKHYRGNFNGTDSSINLVGTVPNVNRLWQEDGLWGIALDPDFRANYYIYVLYAYSPTATEAAPTQPSDTTGWRLSRFSLIPGVLTLIPSSEQVLLHIPAGVGNRWHTGGSLRFDHAGNLYVSLGDNESLMMGPGNTADLRGGILRIKPTQSGGYSIPAGNFGEHWADYFQTQGRTTLAAQYRDTSKVRPEIYVKGSRNPYSFGIDPNVPGRVTWPECGPDVQRAEEHNITSTPAFSGWPFWSGSAVRQQAKATSYDEPNEPTSGQWGTYNPSTVLPLNPVNTWPGANGVTRKGVDTLPPMHQPAYSYSTPSLCALGGPIIRYDGRSSAAGKLPPHFDNVWMFTDYMSQNIWAFKLDSAGEPLATSPTPVFLSANYARSTSAPVIGRPIDFQQGPDGALYMMNWGAGCCDGNTGGQSAYAGIARIAYTGPACSDPSLFPAPVSLAGAVHRGPISWFHLGAQSFAVRTEGAHEVRILDLSGRLVRTWRGVGPKEYSLPERLRGGMYVLQARTPQGIAVRTFSRL